MGKRCFSPYLKGILINRYIGREIYNSVHPETRNILIREALETFKREKEAKFGSLYNYYKDWCKRNGFETPHEYNKFKGLNYSYKKEYYQKNKEKMSKRMKEYLKKPGVKEKIKEYNKEYQRRDYVKEKRKEYYSKPEVKRRRKEYYQRLRDKNKKE